MSDDGHTSSSSSDRGSNSDADGSEVDSEAGVPFDGIYSFKRGSIFAEK